MTASHKQRASQTTQAVPASIATSPNFDHGGFSMQSTKNSLVRSFSILTLAVALIGFTGFLAGQNNQQNQPPASPNQTQPNQTQPAQPAPSPNNSATPNAQPTNAPAQPGPDPLQPTSQPSAQPSQPDQSQPAATTPPATTPDQSKPATSDTSTDTKKPDTDDDKNLPKTASETPLVALLGGLALGAGLLLHASRRISS